MIMSKYENARFTVTYSHNCDGGVQELSAAAKCIRDIFPDCEIISQRVNSYPIKVIIEVESDDDEVEGTRGKKLVWSGKQQNLFEKYENKRSKAMKRIKSKLVDLRKSSSQSSSPSLVTASSPLVVTTPEELSKSAPTVVEA